MGVINQGILGPVSGQIGNVIGGTWKGIDYLRIAPASVANPNTPAQQETRAKFTTVLRFLQPVTRFVRVGFRNLAIEQTGFNAAMSYNYHNAVEGTSPLFTINYANVLLAKGSLAPALNPAATSTVAGTVAFTWDYDPAQANAAATDQTLIIAYNTVKNEAVYQLQQATRSELTQSLTVPDAWSTDTVQTWIAMITTDGQLLSNSLHCGAVVVA